MKWYVRTDHVGMEVRTAAFGKKLSTALEVLLPLGAYQRRSPLFFGSESRITIVV